MPMWIRRLEVTNCAGIAAASVDFERGLNVLYGPNELGKSSLVQAVRAALLLRSGSSAADRLRDWHIDAQPSIALTFEEDVQRVWRVRKSFAVGGGHAYLEFSRDGRDFSQDSRGREVDGKLQDILRWGVAAPGGRGGRRGMPESLITTALLGEQGDIAAILKGTLAGDADESGREHLTRALQGLAEDPRLKTLLNSVQEKVDEAFTATGRRKSGRASPWAQLREEQSAAEARERDVRGQFEASEGARLRVEELRGEQRDAASAADHVRRVFNEAKAVSARRGEIEEARGALDEAQKNLERVEALFEARDASIGAAAKARAEIDALSREHADAERAFASVVQQVEAARERVREIETGGDEQQRRLREQEAENEHLVLVHKEQELERQLEDAGGFAELDREIAAGRADVEAREAKQASSRALLDKAAQATAADEDRLEDLEVEGLCARYLAALKTALGADEQLEAALEQTRQAAARAGEAEALRAEAEELHAPSAEQIEKLKRLETDLHIAREKLAVGLVVGLTLEHANAADARVDGVAQTLEFAEGERVALEAERELRLEIPGIGALHVQGGSLQLVGEAEAAEERSNAFREQISARIGTGSLAEVEALRGKADDRLAAAEILDRAAAEARVRAEGVDELERGAALAQGECEGHRQAVAAFLEEGASVDAFIDGLAEPVRDESVIADEKAVLEGGVSERRELCRELQVKVEGDSRDIANLQQNIDDKQVELRRADGDWRSLLAGVEEQRSELARLRKTAFARLEAIRVEATAEVDEARDKLKDLTDAQDEARRRQDTARVLLNGKREVLAGLEGEAKAQGQAAEGEDIDVARADRNQRQEILQSLPAAPEAPGADLEELERGAEDAERQLQQVESEIVKSEGALEQVGGQYVEEQVEQAQQALTALSEREHDLKIEYGAWKLLGDTLREAQKTDSAHLGNALAQPVSARMAELTQDRYGEVAVGPQLDATGIRLGGAERDFGELSVGTQEQIALLLRVSIAEALGAFVILDDQLTQSDAARMAWLRGLLEETAGRIQVVVMTCHPEDYGTGPRTHVVDLTESVTRSANSGAVPATASKDGQTTATPDYTETAEVPSASVRETVAVESRPMLSRRRKRTRLAGDELEEQDLATALRKSLGKSDS